MSIHELLAVARESEDVYSAKGDAMLCDKRFKKTTRHMVEITLLKRKTGLGGAGEYHRYFLTEKDYKKILEGEQKKEFRVQRHALVIEGTLHYIPPPAVAWDGERDH